MSALIELQGIEKGYWIPRVRRETIREHAFAFFRPRPFERLEVLRGIDLHVERGETLGIMGRNGSGKSTLLKILCGIYTADRGTVRVRAPLTPLLELGVGWNQELDAIDNILLVGCVMGLSLKQAHAAVTDVLEFAGVERFANLELKHYSSGMAVRLAYAVAFHAVRDVLVLDEVFAVGDMVFRRRCQERYLALARAGHTGILVSHDPNEIRKFCQRAILIEQGRILVAGAPADVVDAYLALPAVAPAE